MTRGELKLNNFEGFDRYLKTFETAEKTGWGVFYDEESNLFTPPILEPETLVEYQLDHYALWMVISKYALKEKPRFFDVSYRPKSGCYACEWKTKNGKDIHDCETDCPFMPDNYLVIFRNIRGYNFCVPIYGSWYLNKSSSAAHKLARLPWRET